MEHRSYLHNSERLVAMIEDLVQFVAESGFAPSTQYGYSYNLKRLAVYLDSHGLTFADLTGKIFLAFLDETGWAGNGRYAMTNAAKSYLRWKYGPEHPFLKLKVRRPKPRPQRTLQTDQVEDLLASIDTTQEGGIRSLALICLTLDSGLRRVELVRADTRYLNLKRRRLEVEIKGGEWASAVFSPYTASCLESWLAVRAFVVNQTASKTPALFISLQGPTRGERISSAAVKKSLERLSKRVGVAFSSHDLRRTFAVLSLKRGASTRLVQAAGRWKTIEMVEHYTAGIDAEDMGKYYPVEGIMSGEFRVDRYRDNPPNE